MEGHRIDYEGALRALQGFLGQQVLVTVSPIDQAEVIVATVVGPLSIGTAEEGGYTDHGLPSGETVTFKVGDHRELGCGGVFVLWRDHFDGGWEGTDADGRPTVICFDRGVGIGVRTA